ncbi:permease prefix domain 2-containing transporter [Tardiphaga sp.]|uniref:permease prefix domain 2-containing transporter n=1 Tax=Tardiphaga sp. TaxID=1926292 RepID=UPI0037D9C680
MNNHQWRITQINDDRFEAHLGDVKFVISGLKDLPEAERLHQVEHIIEQQMIELQRRGRLSAEPPIAITPARPQAEPPALAEAILQWFSPKASCEATLGDLQELFEIDVARLGPAHARRLYWIRVAKNVGPSVWHRVLGLSIVSAFIAYMRGKFGV